MALDEGLLNHMDSESDRNCTDVGEESSQVSGPIGAWQQSAAKCQGWLTNNGSRLTTVVITAFLFLFVGACTYVTTTAVKGMEASYEEEQRFLEKDWASVEKVSEANSRESQRLQQEAKLDEANNETEADLVEKLSDLKKANEKFAEKQDVLRVEESTLRRYEAFPQATKDKALRWAADNGKLEKVQSLIKAGADVEAKDREQNTPLLLAAQSGYLAVVAFLVEQAGADANGRGYCCVTPLMYAADAGNVDVVKYLVKKVGVDPSIKNCCSQGMARDYARNAGHHDVADFLQRHGG